MIRESINNGLDELALSRSPQLSLLQPDFYSSSLLPGFARWGVVWLKRKPHAADAVKSAAAESGGNEVHASELWINDTLSRALLLTSERRGRVAALGTDLGLCKLRIHECRASSHTPQVWC